MVLGHVGRGDEEHGTGHQAELRDGAGTAARDDQVGRRIGIVHPLDEGPLPDALHGVGRQEGLHLALVVLARLPDDLHRGLTAAERQQPRLHHLVQRAGAERTADNQHHLASRREAEVTERLRAVGPLLREAAAERVARQDNLLLREEAFHPLVGGADAAGTPRQNLVRHAGIGVLLLDDGRHTHALGSPQHRGARIAAEADHRIGPEGADDIARLADAPQHLEGDQQVAPLQTALQPGNRQPDDAVTQRRHLFHLHLALGTDEEQLDLVAQPPFQRLGHGYGGIDMAARAAARKNNAFHRISFTAAVGSHNGRRQRHVPCFVFVLGACADAVTPARSAAPLFHCSTVPLFHCPRAPPPRCSAALLPDGWSRCSASRLRTAATGPSFRGRANGS